MEALDDPNQTRTKARHDTRAIVTTAAHRCEPARRRLGALLLAVTVAGCGVVNVKGLPGSSSSSTTPSSSGGGGSAWHPSRGDTPTQGTGDAASVAAAYKKFTFGSCSGTDCQYVFRKAAGVTEGQDAHGYQTFFNPRAAGKNLDPVWLTGWDALPSDPVHTGPVYQALAIAASARSWRARCESDYEALHAKLVAADQKMDAAIAAANALPTRYERLAALLALRTDTQADQEGMVQRELAAEEALRRHVGAPYALELAILDAHRKLDLEYVYFAVPGIKAPDGIVAKGRPRGDYAAEREAYCAEALDGSSQITPGLSVWGNRSIEEDWTRVKAPIDTALVDKITEARKAGYAENKKRFAQATHLDEYDLIGRPTNEGGPKGKLVHIVTDSKVTKVTRSGPNVTVELKGLREDNQPYNCKPTHDIDLDTGRARQACDIRFIRSDVHVTVTFDDMPASVKIEPGDQLDMFARVTAERDQLISHTPALDKRKDDITLAGTYMVRASH